MDHEKENNKLNEIWQSCITGSYNNDDPKEKKDHLGKLLDYCMVYFDEHKRNDGRQTPTVTTDSSRIYIGNWLIHQFIIDLGNLTESIESSVIESEYSLFNDYFTNGIGWKLLQCFSHFDLKNGSLYNVEFAKILICILKTFLANNGGYQSTQENDSSTDETSDTMLNALISMPSNFKNDNYLKTVKNEFLSPSKVKSWIKNSYRPLTNANNNRRKNHYQYDDTTSDEDENQHDPENHLKNTELFHRYRAQRSINFNLDDEHNEVFSSKKLSDNQEKPTRDKLILTIEKILMDFVLFEYKMSNNDNDTKRPKISSMIIEELSNFLYQPLDENKEEGERLNRLPGKRFKIFIFTASMSQCNSSEGIRLIEKCQVIPALLRHIGTLQSKMENWPSLMEGAETAGIILRLLISISQSLIRTKEVSIFTRMIGQVFLNQYLEQIFVSLMKYSRRPEANGVEKILYRFIDLLKELQITIQYSTGLLLHKHEIICSKKKHSRCNLVPLMAHHVFHEKLFAENDTEQHEISESSSSSSQNNCTSSLVYCLLVRMVFICSNNSNNHENVDDRLVEYVCNQLSILISCCCSLKKYCQSLLHFALTNNRSNLIRNAIFNIIEFNVKIQRKHPMGQAHFWTDRCSHCTHNNDICENSMLMMDDHRESINSEGYSTDNGSISMSPDDRKKIITACSESSCMIKSLSGHYMNLLRCDNANTRQTVFRHFFNLFSYLNIRSRKSILLHVIFPIFENHKSYSNEVCSFVLRLLIATTQPCNRPNEIPELLNIFVKANVLPLIRQLLRHSKPLNEIYATRSDYHLSDLSLLSIQLLENLIKCELIHFKNVHNFIINNETELSSKIDSASLQVVPFLVDLFLEQFEICIEFRTKDHFEEFSQSKKFNTADEYVNYLQSVSFNFFDMDNVEMNKFSHDFWCLLKLLTVGNNILNGYNFFRIILNHETFDFSGKLHLFFKKFVRLTLNEIKLFLAMNAKDSSDNKCENHVRFYEKLLKVLEKLAFFTVQLEGFGSNSDDPMDAIPRFIEKQLLTLIDDKLLIWQNRSAANFLAQFLKILLKVAFNRNDDLHLAKYNLNDLPILNSRTRSFDSVVSSEESPQSDFPNPNDPEDVGYAADTECPGVKSPKVQRHSKDQTPGDFSKCSPFLRDVELCRVVFKYLSSSMHRKMILLRQQQKTDLSLKEDSNMVLGIVSLIIQYCKENSANIRILFENGFTTMVIEDFHYLLISTSFEDKPVKIALFDFFILLTKNKLRPAEIKMFLELFKHQESDNEFLISILHKILFSKHHNSGPPQHCLRFPAKKLVDQHQLTKKDWIDRIIEKINENYGTGEYEYGFKSFALALPLNPTPKNSKFKHSLVFWIYFDKMPSLVDKFFAQSESKSQNKMKSKEVRQVHIISFVFDRFILELWFDYLYNRFVYRLGKENIGKVFYLNESFVASNHTLLGQWNFVGVELEERCDTGSRTHFLRIRHSVNCCTEKNFNWSYPSSLYESTSNSARNNAILFGSCQDVPDFQYKVSNLFMFKENLSATVSMIMYSLGPDFSNLHHLESEAIQEHGYFVVPHQLVDETESNIDVLTAMTRISVANEVRFILDNLTLLYKTSQADIFHLNLIAETPPNNGLINPFKLLSANKTKKNRFLDDRRIFQVKMNCILSLETNSGMGKTISDSGGISLFLFLFMYLLEKSESQVVFSKALDLVLHVYESHYYHRLTFDNFYDGYELLLYVMEKSNKTFSTSSLKTFSQFSIHSKGNHSLILSSNAEKFLCSWKIWIRNMATVKQFFQLLNSLVVLSNPYRNYNLAFLKQIKAFSHLIYMIEDIYMNYFDEYHHLDPESLQLVIRLIQTLLDNYSDFDLYKIVFHCLLLLQNSEWLHVNQGKVSSYYLFPSTWITYKDDETLPEEVSSSMEKTVDIVGESLEGNQPMEKESSLEDWEIVSEFFENSSPLSSAADETHGATTKNISIKPNSESVTSELIMLVNKYLDQATDLRELDVIFEDVSCIDFLIVLVNNPSDRVREAALMTFFKLFDRQFDPTKPNEWSMDGKVLKNRSLYLLMVSNQLHNYMATERIVEICIGFIFNLNPKKVSDLLYRECDQTYLKKLLSKVSLENFIPFLAVLPKCIESLSFCYKILQFFDQIITKMSLNQIDELQKEYGLVQSLSKLLINLNRQPFSSEDFMNEYTKDNLNEAVCRIVYNISFKYHLNNDSQLYANFLSFTNQYSIIERKVTKEVSQAFRQIQVSIFQASFEALNVLQTYFDKKNDSGIDYFGPYEDWDRSSNNVSQRTINSQPKIILERLKIILKKSVLFLMCRDHKNGLCQKEKYFQREVLYHLLKLVDQCENVRSKAKNAWLKSISGSKDYFKSHLNRILLLLMSHLQRVEDRIFSLNLFFEKTKEFELIQTFIDKKDDRFYDLFEGFLKDLMERGIEDLNIYSRKDPDDLILNFNKSNFEIPQDNMLSLEYVCKRFKQHSGGSDRIVNSDNEIVRWHEQIHEMVVNYEQELLKSSNKLFANMTVAFNKVLESATALNNQIILAQNKEKNHYILHLKQEQVKNKATKKRFFKLVSEVLHEKSGWYLKDFYPQSWELSPFESQRRIRKKMERCFLEIDNRYVMNSSSKKLRSQRLFGSFMEDDNSSFFNAITMSEFNKFLGEDASALIQMFTASVILYDEQIEGEILIKKNCLQFVANNQIQTETCLSFSSKKTFFQNFTIEFDEIQKLIKCRYELQNKAIEIFLTSGLSYLIAFETSNLRDECHQHLMSNKDLLPNLVEGTNLITLTQMWRERRISNFDYLMQLNKLSGRSFNDLMQYPVFPFVLSDYQSDILNLMDVNSFRDLARPIAVQKKEREKYYVEQYNYIKAENSLMKDRERNGQNTFHFIATTAPYHYGAHYSNSGIVLYYLVRLPPYTQMFLQYQDKNFDIPDRTFHSLQTTWRLATEDSTNGFKELIPEFFYLPEFLMNTENYNLGVRQNGERVHDVILPPWCRNNARLFTLINLQALESNYVTQHLNHWIDLIFGFQQTGDAAVKAVNVFHPATHFTADLSKIEDDVKRHALKTMIKTYGQMPSQLFNLPHPKILPEVALPVEDNQINIANSPSMGEVIGLKWGMYVGSPAYGTPALCFQRKFNQNIDVLWTLPTNDVLLLPTDSCPLVAYNQQRNVFINTSYIVFYALCTWSPVDTAIWFCNQDEKCLFAEESLSLLDKVCLCSSIPDYEWLLIGYESGMIVSYPLKFNSKYDLQQIKLRHRPTRFVGHESAITSITMNNNYNVALSTDQNGVAIVWDMNKQQYLRTIMERSDCPAKLSAISNTLGDLAVVTYAYRKDTGGAARSKLSIFTLNGIFVGDVSTKSTEPYFTALCYSNCPEGLSINIVATGMSDGSVKMWSSWDLTLVREIKLDQFTSPIKSISFSFKCDILYIINCDNHLLAFKNSSSVSSNSANVSSSTSASTKSDNFRLLNLANL